MGTNYIETESTRIYDRGVREGEARGEAKGRAEGREETILKNIESLMETLSCSFDKAAEALKLSTEEISYYQDLYLANNL